MYLVLLLVLVIDLSSSARITRQVDGGFWWENLGNDGPPTTIRPVIEDPPLPDEANVKVRQPDVKVQQPDVKETVVVTPSYEPCSGLNRACVPWNLCRKGTIVTDGSGTLSLRNGLNVNQHSECPGLLEVCCQEPEDYDYVTGDEIEKIKGKVPVSMSTCGQRNYDGIGAKINNLQESQSQFGEFPWMTAVLRLERFTGSEFKLYLCGGSLISARVVLTGAHCVANLLAKDLLVRVGEWDTQNKNEQYPHQERMVEATVVHPKYNPASLFNDVALLIISEPVVAAPNVQTICLPHSSTVFDGTHCFSTGWGKEQFGENGTYQNILKKVDLQVVPSKPCETRLKSTRLGNYFKLHNSFICAGGKPGKDTCKGDGGSPLVCKITASDHHTVEGYYQAGIVAWGIGCGEDGLPGVYAKIPHVVDWIREELAKYPV